MGRVDREIKSLQLLIEMDQNQDPARLATHLIHADKYDDQGHLLHPWVAKTWSQAIIIETNEVEKAVSPLPSALRIKRESFSLRLNIWAMVAKAETKRMRCFKSD